MEPELLRYEQDDLPPALRDQVRALHRQAWPPSGPAREGPAHDPALRPLSLTLVADGRVLAALDILSKQLEHAGERFAASGLSTVVTDEELRGRGYGRRLVIAARATIAASGADLGIFTCDRPLGAFYEAAGWAILPGTVLVGGTPEEPFPSDQWDKVTLASFFGVRAQAAAPAFAGARIGLYPGSIDRLW
ncbi:MAG TPA: GNAT family N-acetyltransferase [Gaiellales bacterium]|jgi:GNAT superfamily N-acetyltransferase